MKNALSGKVTLLAIATSFLLFTQASYAQAIAGVVKNKEGAVQIVRGTTTLPVEVGTQVRAGDVLKTAKDSSVGLMLKDETRMALGPNSQVALDKFGFSADTYAGNIFVNVLKGTMAMITGLVIKNNPANSTIKTPTSTAGIRGTTLVVDVP
jgi:hypothetical protein